MIEVQLRERRCRKVAARAVGLARDVELTDVRIGVAIVASRARRGAELAALCLRTRRVAGGARRFDVGADKFESGPGGVIETLRIDRAERVFRVATRAALAAPPA